MNCGPRDGGASPGPLKTRMTSPRAASWIVLGTALMATFASPARAEPRAVVELFTSQGCSSCPAADKLAGELAKDPTLVVMSLAIDYWDYLGWKDTLASPRHSVRQRAYARSRGDRQVYTPQVVINGSVHALGSDKVAIENAIAQSRRSPTALSLPVSISVSGDQLAVSVPAGQNDRASGEVWLCALTKAIPVAVGRGENSGRTITYHNVSRRWLKLGEWTGGARTWTAKISDLKAEGVDAAAVIVQGGSIDNPGQMYGASFTSIR
jgi:hypothetical protein